MVVATLLLQPPHSSAAALRLAPAQANQPRCGDGSCGDSNTCSGFGWLMGVAALLVIGLGVGLAAFHFQNVRS